MTILELNDLIDFAVNPKGGDPKIEGPALNTLLKTLATEFNKAAEASILEFVFETGFADAMVRTLGSRQVATYRTEQLQNVKDVIYRINDNIATLPFAVQTGDILTVTITRMTAGQGAIVSLEN